ncbi:hypothetical protein DQ384_38140 [Sphaerisporangium album]|uniref:Cysteine dioxygenase n=1 Tax=Sphaerisporangium album TaxID=509200 RepID=A0A367EMA6_9ACTN|nr:hypothetical protein [Sphaerisporangium album]RCG19103.1 hypothetical protein DQ384_38140 [Sphaerisporangium album]
MSVIDPHLPALRALDWDDTSQVQLTTAGLLADLAQDRAALRAAVEAIRGDAHLQGLCEHYDILDKLVLHDDRESGFRLRLHLFGPDHYDRPHNHRWTYSARLLTGSYTHTLYGTEEGFNESIDVRKLHAKMVRTEKAGDSYTLHHTMVHAAVAEPDTVSLIARGPAVKDRFLVTDRATGQVWWQYGAAQESPEQAAAKRMTLDQFDECLRTLHKLHLL